MSEKNSRLVSVPPPIAPQEILRIARDDCEEWRQLTFESNSAGARIFNAFATAIIALTEAVKAQAAHDAIYAVVAWCENYDQQQTSTPAVSRAEVEKEVARFKEWLRAVYRLMTPLQDELNEINDLQQQEMLSDRCGVLQRAITELAQLAEPVDKQVTKLEHYLSSLVVVERGIPRDLLEKPLPSLPDSVGIAAVDLSASTLELVPVPVTVRMKTETSSERVETLAALVRTHGLLAIQIMVFSLFDLFGPWNAVFAGKQRSLMRVLQTADDIGVLESYGWTVTARDAIKGTHWGRDATNVATFLKYAGNVSGNILFVRNDRTLPWDARSLFTDKEVAQFLAIMKAPTLKRA